MTVYSVLDEKTTGYLTAEFKDKNDDDAVPTSISYRIDCLTTGTAIKGATPVTPPAASVEIVLSSDDNRIITDTNKYERRIVTVTAIYGASDQINKEYKYDVKNLKAVT